MTVASGVSYANHLHLIPTNSLKALNKVRRRCR